MEIYYMHHKYVVCAIKEMLLIIKIKILIESQNTWRGKKLVVAQGDFDEGDEMSTD